MKKCRKCFCTNIDKGRAFDGRRAYRCNSCNYIWTEGMQGRQHKYSKQMINFQFKNERC